VTHCRFALPQLRKLIDHSLMDPIFIELGEFQFRLFNTIGGRGEHVVDINIRKFLKHPHAVVGHGEPPEPPGLRIEKKLFPLNSSYCM
jgi:hypothetical protein